MPNLGKDSIGANTFVLIPNERRTYKHDLETPITLTDLRMYLTGGAATHAVRLVIYADDGSGAPGSLIVQSNEVVIGISQAASWVTFTLPSNPVLGAGTYHLGFISGASAGPASTKYDTTAETQQWVFADTYSDGAANPAGTTVDTGAFVISVYGTYTLTGPINTDPPQVSGTPQVGRPLKARDGTWAGSGLSYTYQWQLASMLLGPWTHIVGATGSQYTPQTSDVGRYIRCLVIATQASLTNNKASNIGFETIRSFGSPVPTNEQTGFALGGAFTGRTQAQQQLELDDLAALAPSGYVRFEISWPDIEASNGVFTYTLYDRIFQDIEARGLKVLPTLLNTPAWARVGGTLLTPPTNNSDFADFATQITNRYKPGGTAGTNVKVWEIWNEPNISGFWGGATPDVVKYTGMLIAAYDAIKAADPTATVLTAGFAPYGSYGSSDASGVNPKTYLEAIYTNGGGAKFDGVAWHTYASTDVQDYRISIYSGWSDLEDNTVSVRSILAAKGHSYKPIWITEHGLPIGQTGSKYPAGVTAQNAADFLTEGYARWARFTWPKGASLFFSHRPSTGAGSPEEYGVVTSQASPLVPRNGWYAARDFARGLESTAVIIYPVVVPGPMVPEAIEWVVVHKAVDGTRLGEIRPNNLDFKKEHDRIGTIAYDIPKSGGLAKRAKTEAYVTDFELQRNGVIIMEGLHTAVKPQFGGDLINIAGKDYLHYLDGRFFPFDPNDPGFYSFAMLDTDLFTIVESLLDIVLSLPYSLVMQYSNGLSGILGSLKIDPGDTSSILSKITELSEQKPGFDFEMRSGVEFKMFAHGKGVISNYRLEYEKNIKNVEYGEQGIKGTSILGTASASSSKIGVLKTGTNIQKHRRWDHSVEFQSITDLNALDKLTEGELDRTQNQEIELTVDVQSIPGENIWKLIEPGYSVHIYCPLDYDTLDGYYKCIGMQGTPGNTGDEVVRLTFDDNEIQV